MQLLSIQFIDKVIKNAKNNHFGLLFYEFYWGRVFLTGGKGFKNLDKYLPLEILNQYIFLSLKIFGAMLSFFDIICREILACVVSNKY